MNNLLKSLIMCRFRQLIMIFQGVLDVLREQWAKKGNSNIKGDQNVKGRLASRATIFYFIYLIEGK